MRNYNIQALRALAAYAVVGHHVVDSLRNYIAIGRFTANPMIGATGVDVFFVISGYVMMLTAHSKNIGAATFLGNRFVRVVPMYWIMTVAASLLILSGLNVFGNESIDLSKFLSSIFFIPIFAESGKFIHPIVFPGWTLNYEMMFYGLFAIFLAFAPEKYRTLSIIIAIFSLWMAQASSSNYLLDYFGSDVILSFAGGVMLWPLVNRVRMPPWAAWSSIPPALVLLASTDYAPVATLPHGHITVCLGATLLVFAILALEKSGTTVGPGWWDRQGNASYSLYLVHPFVIQILSKISVKSGLNDSVPGLMVGVAAMVIGSGVAGTLIHRHMENAIIRYFRGRSLETIAALHDTRNANLTP